MAPGARAPRRAPRPRARCRQVTVPAARRRDIQASHGARFKRARVAEARARAHPVQAGDDAGVVARAEAPGAPGDLLHLARRQRPLHRAVKLLQRREHDAPAGQPAARARSASGAPAQTQACAHVAGNLRACLELLPRAVKLDWLAGTQGRWGRAREGRSGRCKPTCG